MTIWSSRRVRFRVVIIEHGDKYGLNDSITHDSDEPLVEFYDTRYKHTEYGQFVSRYYLDTLLEKPSGQGLMLHGGVSDWVIDGNAMQVVTNWLLNERANYVHSQPI
jgi:hypothetical protein